MKLEGFQIYDELKTVMLEAYAYAYEHQDFEECERIYLLCPELQDQLDTLLNDLS